uniref:Uncharacterized protein n=1 Tax=Solanum lycopersicum TaxID=4081 RepID=A0A3Q7ESJ5_SOLLC
MTKIILYMQADKSKIVYEALNCIRKLQNTFNKLESSQKVGYRLEKYAGDHGSTCNSTTITQSSTNVVLNVAGEDAHISVCCPKKPGLFTTICYVLEKH